MPGQQDARELRQACGQRGQGPVSSSGRSPGESGRGPVWAGERVREAREEPFQRGAQGRASCNVGGQLSAMERRLMLLARSTQEDSISAPVEWNTGGICTAGEGRAHSLQSEPHACSERRAGPYSQTYAKNILITMVRCGTVTQQRVLV